jgi:hypothetical protein
MPDKNSFNDLILHDGPISSIEINWEKKICAIKLAVFIIKDEFAVDCILQFDEVSRVDVPLQSPWADSVYINEQREEAGGVFLIEMQSGDEIRITAKSFKLVRVNAAA